MAANIPNFALHISFNKIFKLCKIPLRSSKNNKVEKQKKSGRSKNPEQNCKFIHILIELFTNPQNSKIPYKALDILDFWEGNFFQILPSAQPLMK